MSVQRISSFKSFTEVKNQQASIKMHEENKTKREQLLAKIGQTLEEMGVTSLDELDEEKRTALVAKIFNEDRAEDIEAAKVKMGEPKKHEDEEGKAVQSTNESLITEATRSQIGKIDKAGKITSVYVHWDGSPDTRVPLLKHYTDVKTIDKLLNLGKQGISQLGREIGNKPQDFNNPEKGITVFYGRDRDEKNDMTMKSDVKSITKYLKDAGNHSSAEYVYLFDERDGKWYMADVYDDKELKPVKESVEVNEGKQSTSILISKIEKLYGKKPSCSDLAEFIWNNFNAVTGWKKSERGDEFNFPDAIIDIVQHYDYDVWTEFSECWADEAEYSYESLKFNKVNKVNEDIDIHDKLSDLMNKLQVQIGNLLHTAKGNSDWTRELNAIKKAFETLEDRMSIASKKLGMIPESVVTEAVSDEQKLVVNFLNKIAKEFDYSVKDAAGFVMYTITKLKLNESAEVNEADKPAGLTKDETMKIAQKFADAISKVDGKKVTVNKKTLEEDSFDLDIDGEEFDGGSYMIFRNGNVRNAALSKNPIYGKTTDSVDTIVKNLKALKESVELNEARSINKIQNEWTKVTAEMKSTVDSWKKAEGDAKAPLLAKLKELTAKKNALESELNDAISDKDKDLELVVSEGNAFVYAAAKAKQEGKKEFEFNGKTYKVTISDTSLSEEVEVNEGKYSKDQLLKLIAKLDDAEIIVKGKPYIIYNPVRSNLDNAAMWGNDTITAVSSDGDEFEFKYSDIQQFNESIVNEEDIKSDEQFKEYAFKVLKQAFEADFDETKAQEVVDGILKVAKGNYGEAVGMLTSSLG